MIQENRLKNLLIIEIQMIQVIVKTVIMVLRIGVMLLKDLMP